MIKCPVCKREFINRAGFNQHAKSHVRRGELIRKEIADAFRAYPYRIRTIYVRAK